MVFVQIPMRNRKVQISVINSILSRVDLQVRFASVGELVRKRMCRHVECVKTPVVIFHLLVSVSVVFVRACACVCMPECENISSWLFAQANICFFTHYL